MTGGIWHSGWILRRATGFSVMAACFFISVVMACVHVINVVYFSRQYIFALFTVMGGGMATTA